MRSHRFASGIGLALAWCAVAPLAAVAQIGDETIRGHLDASQSARIERTADFRGTLCAWARGVGCEVELAIERPNAERLTCAPGAAPSPTPWLACPLSPGDAVVIAVTCRGTAGGEYELHLFGARESDITDALADRARVELPALGAPRGDARAEAARTAAAIFDELLAAPGAADSALIAYACAAAGGTLQRLGDRERPPRALKATLDFLERAWPDDYADRLGLLSQAGQAAYSSGDLPLSRQCFEELLTVIERTLPEDSIELAGARGELANTLLPLGELTRARELREAALAGLERSSAATEIQLVYARANLAQSCKSLGDVQRARDLEQQVVAVFERRGNEDDLDLARARHNLATTLCALQEFQAAKELEERVLAVLEKLLPDDDLDLQRPRSVLAQILRDMGDFRAARELLERVCEVRSAALPPTHWDVQIARYELGLTLVRDGEPFRGRELLAETLRIAEESRADVESTVDVRHDLSMAELSCGELESARALTVENLRLTARAIRLAAATASPREIQSRATTMQKFAAWPLLLAGPIDGAERDSGLERDAFEMIESVRSIAFTCARELAFDRRDPESAALRARLTDAAASLALAARQGAPAEAITRLTEARDAAWTALRERAALDTRAASIDVEPDSAALAQRLAPDQALIAYWRHPRSEFDRADLESLYRTSDHLTAFVLRRGAQLQRIELGPIAPIAAAAARWRDALAQASASAEESRSAGEAVRAAVFDPLRAALGDKRRVIVVLDDFLHAVPLDALPDGDGPLGLHISIELRSTCRELLWPEVERPADGALLALGGIDFGDAPAAVEAGASTRGAWSVGFTALPATEHEARGVAELFAQAFPKGRKSVLTGGAATRSALIASAPDVRWLHVATHGWFDAELERLAQGGGSSFAVGSTEPPPLPTPLAHCGIALAGANVAGDSGGVFTAEELAALDLSGCRLAVLSACDTTYGLMSAGQGVASLQQAAQLAGARSVVTSLWKVPDEPTRELMLELYRRMWIGGESMAKALWNAKMSLRAQRRPARDWAGWVLVGPAD